MLTKEQREEWDGEGEERERWQVWWQMSRFLKCACINDLEYH